jgi:hypothetical protein
VIIFQASLSQVSTQRLDEQKLLPVYAIYSAAASPSSNAEMDIKTPSAGHFIPFFLSSFIKALGSVPETQSLSFEDQVLWSVLFDGRYSVLSAPTTSCHAS